MTDLESAIALRFVHLVAKQKGIEAEKVVLQNSFVDDLGFDSLDSVELAMAVEGEFSVRVTDADEERLARVGEYVKFIAQMSTESRPLGMVA